MKGKILNLSLMLSVCVLCLIGFEIYLRNTMDLHEISRGFKLDRDWQNRAARIGFWNRYKDKEKLDLKNYDPQLGWDYELDSQRIRGKKIYSKKKIPGTLRILMLGDSYTYGNEVGDEENYPFYLEGLLPKVEVLNMGVGGYGIDQIFLKYQYFGKDYSPDLVIAGLYVSMFNRANGSFTHFLKPTFYFNEQSQAIEMKNRHIPDPASVLAQTRKMFQWISYGWLLAQRYRKLISGPQQSERKRYYKDVSRIVEYIFYKLKQEVNDRGAELIAAQIPQAERFLEKRSLALGEEFFLNTIRLLGVPVINIEREFIKRYGKAKALEDFYIHRPDGILGHFSPNGNRAAAGVIASYLCDHYKPVKNINPSLTCSF